MNWTLLPFDLGNNHPFVHKYIHTKQQIFLFIFEAPLITFTKHSW